MRKIKFLNLTVAIGLIAVVFATAAATVSANTPFSPTYGPEQPGNPTIFFPFVHNASTVDGIANVSGAVAIQNLELFPVSVNVMDASWNVLAGNVLLNPRASKTWTAAQLGVAAGGGGVIATASWTKSAIIDMLNLGMCQQDTQYTETVTKGAPNASDQLQHSPVYTVSSVTYTDSNNVVHTYTAGTDYTVDLAAGKINWSPAGAEPPTGAQYVVVYTTADCGVPSIGGAEKHMAPSQNGNPLSTSAAQTTVDGSTSVPLSDLAVASDWTGSLPELDLNNQFRWVLPIVQTNSGWDSVIHVTNVNGSSNVGVNAYFYAANGQGVAGPSEQLFSVNLAKGQTKTFDLMADGGFPAGVVGSVWIDGDGAIVASVDRVKSSTDMALTNVAQPRTDNSNNYYGIYGTWPTTKYAPLVFRDYNNWNTGINIANLSSNTNQVTINYYNYSSNAVAQETVNIPPRAMEYVYRPGQGDQGQAVGQISSAVIQGTDPIAVAVDEVKYTGSSAGTGHAMSYPAQEGAFGGFALDTGNFPPVADRFNVGRMMFRSDLSLPIVQKGSNLTGMGDYSGINLFNADPNWGIQAWVLFEDSSGLPVAPTTGSNERELPIKLPLGPLASATVYTANYSEMPDGFTGSAVVGAVYSDVLSAQVGQQVGIGPLVAVSNNVNYAVSGDGSAVYNLHPYYHNFPNINLGCLYPGYNLQQGGPIDCGQFGMLGAP